MYSPRSSRKCEKRKRWRRLPALWPTVPDGFRGSLLPDPEIPGTWFWSRREEREGVCNCNPRRSQVKKVRISLCTFAFSNFRTQSMSHEHVFSWAWKRLTTESYINRITELGGRTPLFLAPSRPKS